MRLMAVGDGEECASLLPQEDIIVSHDACKGTDDAHNSPTPLQTLSQ